MKRADNAQSRGRQQESMFFLYPLEGTEIANASSVITKVKATGQKLAPSPIALHILW